MQSMVRLIINQIMNTAALSINSCYVTNVQCREWEGGDSAGEIGKKIYFAFSIFYCQDILFQCLLSLFQSVCQLLLQSFIISHVNIDMGTFCQNFLLKV